MKRILILLLLLASPVMATNRYVDSVGGSDDNAGTSALPFKTIAKVNATTHAAGDTTFFKRGGVWLEQLTVPNSGSAGNPIVFAAYGTGALPEIRGDNTVTGEWTEHSANVWKATIPHADSSVFALWNNGVAGVRVATLALINSANKWQKFIGETEDTIYLYSATQPTAVSISNRTCVYANSKTDVTVTGLRFVHGYSAISISTGNVWGGTGWTVYACRSDSAARNGTYSVPTVTNSVFVNNNSSGIYTATVANHNTIVGGVYGVQRNDITGMSIKNNIFYRQATQFISFNDSPSPYAPNPADHAIAGNVYSAASLNDKWKSKAGTLFDTLTAWADSTGDLSTQAGDIDLKFTNAAAGDYSLASDSPAKDAGVTGLGVTTDFLGATRDATPDIGAYEFVAEEPETPVPVFRAGEVWQPWGGDAGWGGTTNGW